MRLKFKLSGVDYQIEVDYLSKKDGFVDIIGDGDCSGIWTFYKNGLIDWGTYWEISDYEKQTVQKLVEQIISMKSFL